MATQMNDLEFLKTPEKWPNYPVCPVKRYTKTDEFGFPECGLVFSGDIEGERVVAPSVVMLNLFAIRGLTKAAFDQAQKYPYESLEDLVADGWVVD